MSDGKLHIAIIPDGNRRWAKKRLLDPWDGHRTAIENFRSLTKWCRNDPRVSALTVWCFSTENWKRDPKEVAMLMKLLEDYLAQERKGFLDEKTRFVHSGRKDRIPASLAALIADVEAETKDQTGFTLNLAVDYGGKDEIIRAVSGQPFDTAQGRLSAVSDEESLRNLLDHPELPDIDLVIRTSGEMRTSNFFLWQTTYSEWEFIDKFFPDFTAQDLEECVNRFAARTRRFGG